MNVFTCPWFSSLRRTGAICDSDVPLLMGCTYVRFWWLRPSPLIPNLNAEVSYRARMFGLETKVI